MAVNEEGIINFHVANRAATHLGRKLYSTTPPALAELIANSYDAYATEVRVTIDKDIDHIIVADNGMGMNLDSLNEKYALIGKEKIAEAAPIGLARRSPMGQKGIGKLASFSLGNEYEVYTKTADDTQWRHFAVKYADFISDDSDIELRDCGVARLAPALPSNCRLAQIRDCPVFPHAGFPRQLLQEEVGFSHDAGRLGEARPLRMRPDSAGFRLAGWMRWISGDNCMPLRISAGHIRIG